MENQKKLIDSLEGTFYLFKKNDWKYDFKVGRLVFYTLKAIAANILAVRDITDEDLEKVQKFASQTYHILDSYRDVREFDGVNAVDILNIFVGFDYYFGMLRFLHKYNKDWKDTDFSSTCDYIFDEFEKLNKDYGKEV